MKKKPFVRKAFILTMLLASIFIMAFRSDTFRPNFEPIFMTRAEMESSIRLLAPRPIANSGKIWVYGDYILLVEQFRGIHVIDNSNPNNSVKVAFLHVDGCTEVAVNEDGIIYANNAIDMIGIKVNTNFEGLEVVSRNRNILQPLESPEPWDDWYYVNQIPDDMIIVRWRPFVN